MNPRKKEYPEGENPQETPSDIDQPVEDIDDDFLSEDDEEFPADIALIERGAMCNVEAEYVEMYQSAVVMTTADTVTMNESASFVIAADDIEANNSCAFLVVASDVEGEIKSLFTPLTAAIFGGALAAGIFLLSALFRRR
jgi:hypothetical protein